MTSTGHVAAITAGLLALWVDHPAPSTLFLALCALAAATAAWRHDLLADTNLVESP